MTSIGLRPALLFFSFTGVNTAASISARKLSNGTTRAIISSGSPFAVIAASRRSASKNPNCPIVPTPANLVVTNQTRTNSRRSLFFEVPYSLHDVASRPAKVGDKLVTTQFANSITRGFAAVGEPNVAVCLLPGTEVAFEKEIEFVGGPGSFLNWKRAKRIGDKVARFRQVNKDQPHIHHDALEFPNGECVLLT